MEERWKKITAERAGDIIDVNDRFADFQEPLSPDMRPEDYIRALSNAERWLDANRVMAHALPRREAVWWACLCAKQTKEPPPDSKERAALAAAVKWVYKPGDGIRQEAFRLASEGDPESPRTLAALAAAYSEDVLPLVGGQYLDVEPSAFPQIVFATIFLAANEEGEERADQRLQQFLLSAEEIACGRTGRIEEMQS